MYINIHFNMYTFTSLLCFYTKLNDGPFCVKCVGQ